jgi:hypothetical protein
MAERRSVGNRFEMLDRSFNMHEIGAFGGHPSSHVPKVQTEARRRSVFLEHRAIARTSSVHRAASSEKLPPMFWHNGVRAAEEEDHLPSPTRCLTHSPTDQSGWYLALPFPRKAQFLKSLSILAPPAERFVVLSLILHLASY